MEYVFFDIECACVYKNVAKICVFGYVVCDENFPTITTNSENIRPFLTFIRRSKKFWKGKTNSYSAMPR